MNLISMIRVKDGRMFKGFVIEKGNRLIFEYFDHRKNMWEKCPLYESYLRNPNFIPQ